MTLRLRNTEIEERAKMIADLEQQLLELTVQAPLKPVDHQDADAMLGIDED
jgi:ribosomal protein L29